MDDMYIIKNDSKYEVLKMEELLELARKSNHKIHALKVMTIKRVVAEPITAARIVDQEKV